MSLAVFLVFDFRMLVLRLQRIGKKKKPSYWLIVSEKSKDPQAKNLEILGLYHPVQKETMIELKKERIMAGLPFSTDAAQWMTWPLGTNCAHGGIIRIRKLR